MASKDWAAVKSLARLDWSYTIRYSSGEGPRQGMRTRGPSEQIGLREQGNTSGRNVIAHGCMLIALESSDDVSIPGSPSVFVRLRDE